MTMASEDFLQRIRSSAVYRIAVTALQALGAGILGLIASGLGMAAGLPEGIGWLLINISALMFVAGACVGWISLLALTIPHRTGEGGSDHLRRQFGFFRMLRSDLVHPFFWLRRR
ncbi:hypothetical protein R8Z50_17930 [Longispora sp. K20-0274]|uniref:hypothetical protein n=1 Tax=Longispora sp. K20-0274 TaxID=3088255 RepID=UPI0039995E42